MDEKTGKESDQTIINKSPGQIARGYLPLPVEFEMEMRHFPLSVLKTYLAIRFRTIFRDHVSLTTAALARITNLSEDSVRKALHWLEDPESRDEDARDLPVYISRDNVLEHMHSKRYVQTIFVKRWEEPRGLGKRIKAARMRDLLHST
jgi:hypothetical protein